MHLESLNFGKFRISANGTDFRLIALNSWSPLLQNASDVQHDQVPEVNQQQYLLQV